MPADQLQHIDLTSVGGWIAAGGLMLAWLGRAFAVHKQIVRFQAMVEERLDSLEERQERMSSRFFDEIKEMRRDLNHHRDAHQGSQG